MRLSYGHINLKILFVALTFVRRSVRLKGCEGEVAALVDARWKHITYDWENYDDGDLPVDEREVMIVEDD